MQYHITSNLIDIFHSDRRNILILSFKYRNTFGNICTIFILVRTSSFKHRACTKCSSKDDSFYDKKKTITSNRPH